MTTIAYRDGVLAGDTGGFTGGLLANRRTKVHKLADGRLVCACGLSSQCDQFVRWLQGDEKPGKLPEGQTFAAFVVAPDGTVDRYEDNEPPYRVDGVFLALGAGDEVAMGAMAAGVDAVRAVEIAASLNAFTRLPVVSVRLEPTP